MEATAAAMSSIGLEGIPGTAVLPACWISRRRPPHNVRNCLHAAKPCWIMLPEDDNSSFQSDYRRWFLTGFLRGQQSAQCVIEMLSEQEPSRFQRLAAAARKVDEALDLAGG